MQAMKPEVRTLFLEVEWLVDVVSGFVERSFSCLGRLTWLCRMITQQRLNSVVVCHIDHEALDMLDISAIAAEIAGRSTTRRSVFGNGLFK